MFHSEYKVSFLMGLSSSMERSLQSRERWRSKNLVLIPKTGIPGPFVKEGNDMEFSSILSNG